jgi:hypothetical protein
MDSHTHLSRCGAEAKRMVVLVVCPLSNFKNGGRLLKYDRNKISENKQLFVKNSNLIFISLQKYFLMFFVSKYAAVLFVMSNTV